jgi:hypothetical protein
VLWGAALGLWLAGSVATPNRARATELDQFQNARVAYESLNYELAADLFQGLLGQSTTSDRRPLVLESRKYLGASLLFLGRPAEAEAQYELLLRAEPSYVLDPLTFPAEVNAVFEAVRARLERERREAAESASRDEGAKKRAAAEDRRRKAEQLARLKLLARTERVERERSRWIAALPFGIGQFQNDHDSLGIVLAAIEGTLLVASVTTYVLHQSLEDDTRPTDDLRDDARLAERGFRYGNHASVILFGAVAVGGIVDAQLRFQPSRIHDRLRPLPPDLEGLRLSVRPTPGGLSLSGTF